MKIEYKINFYFISCPDGIHHPTIDCIPDRSVFENVDLRKVCIARKCCWNEAPINAGPNCMFPSNYGFKKSKSKYDTFTNKWFELLRINSPDSYTKSDISHLEAKIEMQTDSRMRLRVNINMF